MIAMASAGLLRTMAFEPVGGDEEERDGLGRDGRGGAGGVPEQRQLSEQLALAQHAEERVLPAQVLPDLDLALVDQESLALGVVAFVEYDFAHLERSAGDLSTRTAHALPSWYRITSSAPMIRRFAFALFLGLLIGAGWAVHAHAQQGPDRTGNQPACQASHRPHHLRGFGGGVPQLRRRRPDHHPDLVQGDRHGMVHRPDGLGHHQRARRPARPRDAALARQPDGPARCDDGLPGGRAQGGGAPAR